MALGGVPRTADAFSTPRAGPRSPASGISIRACSGRWRGRLRNSLTPIPPSSPRSPRKNWPTISLATSPAAWPASISSVADRKRSRPRSSWRGNISSRAASHSASISSRAVRAITATRSGRCTPAFAYHEMREGESDADFVARLAAEIEAEFQRLGPDTVAAFIAEPVVGATAGCVPPPAGYFRAVRDICNRHGALLILDEVMCGMGRTGTRHAWEQEGIAPDIQAIAKGLGGGYPPVGAT